MVCIPDWILPILLLTLLVLSYIASGTTIEPFIDIRAGSLKPSHPILQEFKRRLRYIDTNLLKIPLFLANKSYTYSKREIYLCCYKRDGQLFDINTLMFALLHEIAHVLTDFGADNDPHGEQYQVRFEKLLQLASQKGVWDPLIPIDPSYKSKCGLKT